MHVCNKTLRLLQNVCFTNSNCQHVLPTLNVLRVRVESRVYSATISQQSLINEHCCLYSKTVNVCLAKTKNILQWTFLLLGRQQRHQSVIIGLVRDISKGRGQLKCDGTCAETRFRLSAKRTSRRRRQFGGLLAAELCASAVVMLDTPCSEVVWRVLPTHSIRPFPLHFPSRASPVPSHFNWSLNQTSLGYDIYSVGICLGLVMVLPTFQRKIMCKSSGKTMKDGGNTVFQKVFTHLHNESQNWLHYKQMLMHI